MKFIPIGFTHLSSVSGETVECKIYRVDLGIPVLISENTIFGAGRNINVALLPYQPTYFDVILGMDFLTRYHITLYSNQIIISNWYYCCFWKLLRS